MDKKERIERIMAEGRRIFLKELESNISNVLQKIMHYSLEDGDQQLEDIRRFFHSLKGTSATLQYDDLSFLGAKYEEYMDNIEEEDKSIIVSTLINGVGQVKKELEKIKKNEALEEISEADYDDGEKVLSENIKGQILIVDDDVVLLDLLEKMFRKEGYKVYVTSRPNEVLLILKEKAIDLIVLDVMMPEKTGFQLFEEIRQESIDIPIMFLTGKDVKEEKIRAYRLGADDYIVKPVDVDEVMARVEKNLRKSNPYMYDNLTGAYTKKYFIHRYRQENSRYLRNKNKFSLAFMDLDRFKDINDNYGHLFGDYILKTFVKELKEGLREIDEVYRFGGDEFLVFFPETNGQKAFEALERVRSILGKKTFGNEQGVKISFSAGIATINSEEETMEELLKKADEALYMAKNTGRSKTLIFDMDQIGIENKKKILIVDDANVIVKIIETRLNSLGYEVEYANDGIEALEKSKIMRPDLMIVDLMLPKMDGFELCREVLNNDEMRNTKIIILSSKKREEDIVRCFKIGVHDYMTKPFSVEELEHRINRLFEK